MPLSPARYPQIRPTFDTRAPGVNYSASTLRHHSTMPARCQGSWSESHQLRQTPSPLLRLRVQFSETGRISLYLASTRICTSSLDRVPQALLPNRSNSLCLWANFILDVAHLRATRASSTHAKPTQNSFPASTANTASHASECGAADMTSCFLE